MFLAVLTAIVAVPVGKDLRAAQGAIDDPVDEIDEGAVTTAKQHLEAAARRLDSLPARLLRIVPVVGANLDALDTVASGLPDVLEVGLELKQNIDVIEQKGLLNRRRVDLVALASLAAPVKAQGDALNDFRRSLEGTRSGWLLPPLWDNIEAMDRQIHSLSESIEAGGAFLHVAPQLFGADRTRTYLVMLLNNAELRGAGGILAGVGTISVDNGRVQLGEFESVHDLQRLPPRPVPAPAEYEARYGVYKANTTLWLNTTYSPHLPDVALVASRLYRKVTGVRTDGVLALDPRGIEALLPPREELLITGDDTIAAGELARFVYSDAYEHFSDQSQRRDALLAAGERGLALLLAKGLSKDQRDAAGDAFAGDHIGFVSFDPAEAGVLNDLGVSNALAAPQDDVVRVVVQNMGGGKGYGSKLDYWVRREVKHACDLTGERAVCATEVVLENEVPVGLTRYVAGRPYGLARNYIESYIPLGAEVTLVTLDDAPAEVRLEEQAGQISVGVYTEIPAGETRRLFVRYEMPIDGDRFSIEAIPQPLARDAHLELDVALPPGWQLEGPAEINDGRVDLDVDLDRTLRIDLSRSRAPGLTGLWHALKRFFTEPVFGG